MKLSKDQIKYIDDYLKHHRFKYWDIRFEVLDHIVSSVENKMDNNISFDDALIEVHQSFGNSMKRLWNTGVEYSIFANDSGYKDLISHKQIELKKKYRKLIFKEFKNFFRSFKNLLTLLSVIFIEVFLYSTFNHKIILKINLITMLAPIIVYGVVSIIFNLKFNKLFGPSFVLDTIGFLSLIPLLLVNLVMQILKTDLPDNLSYSLLTGYMIISTIWFLSGVKVYIDTYKRYQSLIRSLKANRA